MQTFQFVRLKHTNCVVPSVEEENRELKSSIRIEERSLTDFVFEVRK